MKGQTFRLGYAMAISFMRKIFSCLRNSFYAFYCLSKIFLNDSLEQVFLVGLERSPFVPAPDVPNEVSRLRHRARFIIPPSKILAMSEGSRCKTS